VEHYAQYPGGGHDVGPGEFLEPQQQGKVITAMAAVIQSVMAWRDRTTTAPHRAPPAAAVALATGSGAAPALASPASPASPAAR